MDVLIIVLTVIVSLLLIGIVLIQKSKGGGLSSSFAGSNQIMGVRRTTDFVEKATWTLASIICVLAITSAFVMTDMNKSSESNLRSLEHVATQPTAQPTGQGQFDQTSAQETAGETPTATKAE